MTWTTSRTTFPLFSLYIYILLCGFQNVLHFPVFGDKLQLTEAWFVVILIYIAFHWNIYLPIFKTIVKNKILFGYGILLFFYLLTCFISFLFHITTWGLLEFIGKIYLVLLQFVFILFFFQNKTNQPESKLIHGFIHLGMLLSILGLGAWILSVLGIENVCTEVYLDYPYFGDTHRLRGFSPTASFYISILTICIACAYYEYLFLTKAKCLLIQALFMTFISVLCFTKSFLFILLVWILFYFFKKQYPNRLLFAIFIGLSFFHLFATHVLILSNNNVESANLHKSTFASGEILYQTNDYAFVASGYYQLKKSAWQLFIDNPIFGIGLGNYNQEIASLKEQGQYPNHLPNYNPHSTFLGMLAMAGLLGFISLYSFFWFYIKDLTQRQNEFRPYQFLFVVLLGIILIEAISMDVMNFRHYWILLGWILWEKVK